MAKFRGDRPTELGDLVAKKIINLKNCCKTRSSRTIVSGGLIIDLVINADLRHRVCIRYIISLQCIHVQNQAIDQCIHLTASTKDLYLVSQSVVTLISLLFCCTRIIR